MYTYLLICMSCIFVDAYYVQLKLSIIVNMVINESANVSVVDDTIVNVDIRFLEFKCLQLTLFRCVQIEHFKIVNQRAMDWFHHLILMLNNFNLVSRSLLCNVNK